MPPLAILGIGLAAAGTATSAVGQIKAGSAAKAQGDANATLAEINAQRSIEDAAIAERQQRTADAQILARGAAIAGASGIDVNSGSPLEVLIENQRQAELNALIIRRGGQLDAQAERAGGAIQKAAGNAAKTASLYGAGSTLLTGGYGITKEVAKL
jgi:hypothetical protein